MKLLEGRLARLFRRYRAAADDRYLNRFAVHREPNSGRLYQMYRGYRVYLGRREDYLAAWHADWICEAVYFKFYRPVAGDTVVDVGAGYGHEAVYLSRVAELRYFAVEIQPYVVSCLEQTFAQFGGRFCAISSAISDKPSVTISDEEDYVRASTVVQGDIEIEGLTWKQFCKEYSCHAIDLLKVNIEGGERDLLPTIGDMSNIKRVIISAHDFRADRGDGENFRTRAFVCDYLRNQGYQIRHVGDEAWLKDWIYGERS